MFYSSLVYRIEAEDVVLGAKTHSIFQEWVFIFYQVPVI